MRIAAVTVTFFIKDDQSLEPESLNEKLKEDGVCYGLALAIGKYKKNKANHLAVDLTDDSSCMRLGRVAEKAPWS